MKADPQLPGYRHIIFKPQPVQELTYVTYTNKTPYGKAGIRWEKENGKFTAQITVPVGCSATVYLPTSDEYQVTESGKKVSMVEGVNFESIDDGYAVYKVQSGVYGFEVNE
jgi:alpha-L-rhamnosidase